MTKITPTPIHQAVQEHYGNLAKNSTACCEPFSGTCGVENLIYPQDLLEELPPEVANFTAGSGDPITLAKLQEGETVLDLGSGGGLDCFLAGKQVGPGGKVIGVDMTPAMLERARANAARMGASNVEFREGFLEDLPVDDASVDVIISNCVINLSPDKPQVLGEMYRTLKPGGRIAISDIVTNHPLPEEALKQQEDWCGCISGALAQRDYFKELEKAGFEQISLEPDLELTEKAIQSGQVKVQLNEPYTQEELRESLRHWETTERNMFLPHRITARKPE